MVQSEFERHNVSSAQNIVEVRHALDEVQSALKSLDIFDDVVLDVIPNREVRMPYKYGMHLLRCALPMLGKS